MKSIVTLILFAIILTGCKQESAKSEFESQLIGEWELELVSNMTGPTNYPQGNGNIMIFEKGGIYKGKQNNILVSEGKFLVTIKNDCFSFGPNTFLTTTGSSSIEMYVAIENGKLNLSTPNCYSDGNFLRYRKL